MFSAQFAKLLENASYHAFICTAIFKFHFKGCSSNMTKYLKILHLEVTKKTQEVSDLIGTKAFKKRQRQDGIIMAITFWQWALEFVIRDHS